MSASTATRLPLLAIAALAFVACSANGLVVISLTREKGLPQPAHLDVNIGSTHKVTDGDVPEEGMTPRKLGVYVSGETGNATVSISARDSKDCIFASAKAMVSVKEAATATVTMVLRPIPGACSGDGGVPDGATDAATDTPTDLGDLGPSEPSPDSVDVPSADGPETSPDAPDDLPTESTPDLAPDLPVELPADVPPDSPPDLPLDLALDLPPDAPSAPPSSCVGLPTTCGPMGSESCCSSPLVQSGTYLRSSDPSFPATVSDFNLDRFEITVGRFRKFVDAGMGTMSTAPAIGAGANPNAPGTGWAASYKTGLLADTAALKAAMSGGTCTWTDSPGSNEDKPITCVTWYELFAFCVWDGGRLPTEAEWNYAAAAGSEQRDYPWGSSPPDASHAVYGDGPPQNVGSKSPIGDGKWGHSDLSGNVMDWTYDWWSAYPLPCSDCANTTTDTYRANRGGSVGAAEPALSTFHRNGDAPGARSNHIGARCARAADAPSPEPAPESSGPEPADFVESVDAASDGPLESTPPDAVFTGCAAVGVTIGPYHGCAVKADETAWCWGSNNNGQLGDGTKTNWTVPAAATALGTGVADVSAGRMYTCARMTDGRAYCWGANNWGQVGDGTTMERLTPVELVDLGTVKQIAAGYGHTCAVKTDGTVWCWGMNNWGELGDGTSSIPGAFSPVKASSFVGVALQVRVGEGHTCALRDDHTVWCWGLNNRGQLGVGSMTMSSSALQVTDLGASVAQIAAGAGNHTCGRMMDGTLWCWGRNEYGQLGTGVSDSSSWALSPVQAVSLGTSVMSVSAGYENACAIKDDGTLWCWGRNDEGQVGNGSVSGSGALATPAKIPGGTFIEVAIGDHTTCARKPDSSVWCWGKNSSGQLGIGSMDDKTLPAAVADCF